MSGFIANKSECRDCFGYHGKAVVNEFCSRHRCTVPGCVERRVAPMTLRDSSWLCQEHSDLDVVRKFMNFSTPGHPGPSNSTPSHSMGMASDDQQPIDPGGICEVCMDEVKGVRRNFYYNPTWFCVQHRCTSPNCHYRRDKLHPRHDLGSSTHNVVLQPKNPQGVPSEPVPPATKRHSRIRSLFNWKSLGKSRSHEPDNEFVETLGYDDLDYGTNPRGVEEAWKRAEVPFTPAVPTNIPPARKPVEGFVNWHQCHAPACQDKVISEEVWVCQKHLEQGFYEPDDPPGFIDAPANHHSP